LVLETVEIDSEHRALFDAGWHPLGNSPDTPAERKKHEDWAHRTHLGLTEITFHPHAYDAMSVRRPLMVMMWGR
jgi:hypothetical protein